MYYEYRLVRDIFHDWNVLYAQPEPLIDLTLAFMRLEDEAKAKGANGQ